MDDLISRQALMKEFANFVRHSNNSDFAPAPTWNNAVSIVGSMPPVQSERPKGEWKTEWHYFFHVDLPVCSYCLEFSPFKYDFCPRCGADMRKVGTPNESKNTRSIDNL